MYILQIFFKPCIYIFKVFESEEGGVLQKKLRCITEKKRKKTTKRRCITEKKEEGGVLQKKYEYLFIERNNDNLGYDGVYYKRKGNILRNVRV